MTANAGSDVRRPERVRSSPAPSGELHLGNARTALVNWLVARATRARPERFSCERLVRAVRDDLVVGADIRGLAAPLVEPLEPNAEAHDALAYVRALELARDVLADTATSGSGVTLVRSLRERGRSVDLPASAVLPALRAALTGRAWTSPRRHSGRARPRTCC